MTIYDSLLTSHCFQLQRTCYLLLLPTPAYCYVLLPTPTYYYYLLPSAYYSLLTIDYLLHYSLLITSVHYSLLPSYHLLLTTH